MIKIFIIIFFTVGLVNAQNTHIYGTLKSIMHGDLSAHFNLVDIKDEPHIFGLGNLENLKGEIIVIDSKPYISRVIGNEVEIDSRYNFKAALFAYNEITGWIADTNVAGLNISELENLLANEKETNPGPVALLFTGKVKSLDWHVLNWAEGDTVHTHEKHKSSGQHGTIKDEMVTIFGYYSKNHKGILTHRYSTLHLHFINDAKTISGHVDNVTFGKGTLKTGL